MFLLRAISAFIFTGLAAQAAESLVLTTQPGFITLPAEGGAVAAPYRNIGDTRVEVRLTHLSTCKAVANGFSGNFFTLLGRVGTRPALLFGLGCAQAGVKSLALNIGGSNPGPHASAQELGEHSDVIVRLQRSSAHGEFLFEVWAPDGKKLATKRIRSTAAAGSIDASPGEQMFLYGAAGVDTTNIAWIRWFRGTVPLESTMPADTGSRGDLGNWEFEGNLDGSGANDISLAMKRSPSGCPDSRCFVPSPMHAPVVQIRVNKAVAGADMELDAAQSFTYDGSPLSKYQWEWLSGPQRPKIGDPRQPTVRVSGLVAGSHVFKLTVEHDGNVLSKELSIPVRNVDMLGLPLLNVAVHQLTATVPVEFDLGSVPGAASVRINVRKPDGRLLPPVVCSQSPCAVLVDNRQLNHSYQLEYRNASGGVIHTTEWATLEVQQGRPPATYSGGGFNKFGTYLTFNSPERLGPALSEASAKFFSKRLYVGINGRNPREWNPDMPMSLRYIDAMFVHAYDMDKVRAVAEAKNFDMESMFGHYSHDFSYKVPPSTAGWEGADRFDLFARDAYGQFADGVYTSNGQSFTDRTVVASGSGTIALTDQINELYVGLSEPFDEVNFVLSRSSETCAARWEYWNGSAWVTLTLQSDSTDGLRRSGRVRFTPSADWARMAMSRARPDARRKWWVRATVSGCSVYPTISKLHGDDLRTGQLNAHRNPVFRGWCSSSPTRINSGLSGDARALEYDPTPPANCSARFRWQARMPGVWSANASMLNVTDVQNGELTAARFLVDESMKHLPRQGWNGIFLDDLFEPNSRDIVIDAIRLTGNQTQAPLTEVLRYTDVAPGNYVDHLETLYDRVKTYLREYDPTYKVGANTGTWQTARHGDMALIELGTNSWGKTFEARADGRALRWDQFKPENNPNGTLGLFAISDTVGVVEATGGPVLWDRGSRGPLTAYSQCLFYGNQNTACFYTTSSPYFYGGRDDFYYWKETPEFITAAPVNASSPSEPVTYVTGDFKHFDQVRAAPVRITSIRGGVVTLAGPATGLGAGQYALLEGTSEPSHNRMVRVASVSGNTFTVAGLSGSSTGGTMARQPAPETMRIGEEVVALWKVDDSRLATAERILKDHPERTPIHRIYTGHLSVDPLPPVERIYRWGYWTPAFDIDPGIPDTENGIVGDDGQKGSRKTEWKSKQQSGTANGISARSFTRALVVWASGWLARPRDYETYSNEIELDGVYYPLQVDGSTGPGITSIRLRSGEGAILMKEPI